MRSFTGRWRARGLYFCLLLFSFLSVNTAAADGSPDLDSLKDIAISLQDSGALDALVEDIGESRYVLLGESSHGTSEYYRIRSDISRRLVEEKGFSFIAVEGDWSACYEVNRYVKDMPGAASDAREALAGFQRWPQWMWQNEETAELIEWLREHNRELPPEEKVGFYGVDLYAMGESIERVINFFKKADPNAVGRIEGKYSSLLEYADNPREYAVAAHYGRVDSSENVSRVVRYLRENSDRYGELDRELYFDAKQNALVVQNAERHYRSSVYRGPESWNRRVEHFTLSVERLMDHYGPDAKGIVWAHNTHVGDARATTMADAGMKNIGQLLREDRGEENVYIVGFGTYEGRVLAGSSWGADVEVMPVPAAARGSFEDVLNRLPFDRVLLLFQSREIPAWLFSAVGHRAKGVVYDPRNDRRNYVPTRVAERYDAFVFIARTGELNMLKD